MFPCVVVSTHSIDPCLWGGGSQIIPPLATNQHISPSGQQLHHSSRDCPQIQGQQCGAYVGAVEEMVCVMCVSVAKGA